MIKQLSAFFKKHILPPEPKVGMRLIDVEWGDWYEIEIMRLSENKEQVLYKFITCKGKTALSGDWYDQSWSGLLTSYKLKEAEHDA